MKVIRSSVTLVAATATAIPLPQDVTRTRRWQLYIESATLGFEILDSDQKTQGMEIPAVTAGSGLFGAEAFGFGDKLWFYSAGTPTIAYVWKEILV